MPLRGTETRLGDAELSMPDSAMRLRNSETASRAVELQNASPKADLSSTCRTRTEVMVLLLLAS
jgi:hypothetical protein